MNYVVRLAVVGALTLTAVPAAAQVEGLRFLNPKSTPMPAAPKGDELPSDLRAYLPQAPKAWKRDGAFDELGLFDPRKSATQGYSRIDGKDGGLTLEIKLPSGLNASRLLGTGGGKRKLGPDDEVPTKVVSEVEINGLKGYHLRLRRGRGRARTGRRPLRSEDRRLWRDRRRSGGAGPQDRHRPPCQALGEGRMNRSHLWLTSLLAGSALAGQIQVGRPPPRQPEKPVVGADQRDPQELLGDCPEQLMRAVRAIDVALVELADCRAASPDNNCPRLEPPLAKAEATYEAVDRSCTALEQPIYRVSRPKADAAIAEGRAASDAARALKADPDRAGAAQSGQGGRNVGSRHSQTGARRRRRR